MDKRASDEKDIDQRVKIADLLAEIEETLRPLTSISDPFTLRLSLPPLGSRDTREFATESSGRFLAAEMITAARCECITAPKACFSVPNQENTWTGLATRCKFSVAIDPSARAVQYNSTSDALLQLQAQISPFDSVILDRDNQSRVKLRGITCAEHARSSGGKGVLAQW